MLWFRLILESFAFAWTAIVTNRLRTFLSLLGVMVGIFMITAVFAVVDSLEDGLKGTFNMLDDEVLFIQKWPWAFDEDYPWWKYVQRREVSLGDAELLEERLTQAKKVVFQAKTQLALESQNSRMDGVGIVAASEGYEDVISLDIAEGRYFSPMEEAGGRAVAIVGHDVAVELTGDPKAIGKFIEAKGQRLEIVGVFAQQGTSVINEGFDRAAIIPAKFGHRVMDFDFGTSIMVKPKDGVSTAELSDEIVQHFRSVRRLRPREEDDFSINQIDMLTSILDNIFAQVEYGGWFIGIFAILVGCFSIANIMFVSVRERTKIIGVQKAIGAKSSFIMLQFLFEAIALCVIGALVALLTIQLIVLILNQVDIGFVLNVHFSRIAIALAVAVTSGLVAGLAPAKRAAQMEPVDAMRSNG
ncbi:MAG: ABC transporter permease [Bacteroidetes bacterium]|nr:ABC transporter permease [Bacteroidota bacterium]